MKILAVALLFLASTALAGAPKAQNESEEEAMITEMENLGKQIQDALAKITAQFKGGSTTAGAADAKKNLEQLARDLEAKKGQLKGGGRQTGSVGTGASGQAETMKMLQDFMKGLTSKVMDNVNQTVDKLNKVSEDTQ